MTALFLFEVGCREHLLLQEWHEHPEAVVVGLSRAAGSRASEMGIPAHPPEHFGCAELDEQIEEEAARASRIWANMYLERRDTPELSYAGVDLHIPAVHRMGIGYYPESFFRRAVRGFRYTQRIITEVAPDEVILFWGGSVAIQGGRLGATMAASKSDLCVRLLEARSLRAQGHWLWLYQLKPVLRLGRDVASACKNYLRFAKAERGSTRQVLYFPVYYNRIRLVRSVLEELAARGYCVRVIASRHDRHKGKMLQALEASGFPFSFLEEYFGFRPVGRLARWRTYSAVRRSDDVLPSDSGDEIASLVRCVWNRASLYYRSHCFYGLARLVEVFRCIIETERPGLLLFNTDEASTGKVAALVGLQYGVPVMSMDHGLQFDSPRISDLLFDKMAVAGPFSKDMFVGRGADREQIEVTGMPIHDAICDKLHDPVNTGLLQELGFEPNRQHILLLTHPATRYGSEQIRRRILRVVIQAVTALPEVDLIIKPHPNETDGLARSELDASGLGRGAVVEDVEKLYDLLHLCDLAVTTFSSTTAIEAVLFDKPVLMLNLTCRRNTLGCAREGAAIEITQVEEVAQTIRDLLYNQDVLCRLQEARQAFIRRYAYRLDGQSHKRVADVAEELIEASSL